MDISFVVDAVRVYHLRCPITKRYVFFVHSVPEPFRLVTCCVYDWFVVIVVSVCRRLSHPERMQRLIQQHKTARYNVQSGSYKNLAALQHQKPCVFNIVLDHDAVKNDNPDVDEKHIHMCWTIASPDEIMCIKKFCGHCNRFTTKAMEGMLSLLLFDAAEQTLEVEFPSNYNSPCDGALWTLLKYLEADLAEKREQNGMDITMEQYQEMSIERAKKMGYFARTYPGDVEPILSLFTKLQTKCDRYNIPHCLTPYWKQWLLTPIHSTALMMIEMECRVLNRNSLPDEAVVRGLVTFLDMHLMTASERGGNGGSGSSRHISIREQQKLIGANDQYVKSFFVGSAVCSQHFRAFLVLKRSSCSFSARAQAMVFAMFMLCVVLYDWYLVVAAVPG